MKSNFKLTQAHLKAWFGEFNRDYFGGKLPEPRLNAVAFENAIGLDAL